MGGQGFEKPSHQQLQAYEEELRTHLDSLKGRLKVAPMNEHRDIKVKALGPAKPQSATKMQELKQRAAELERKPRSVIKGAALQKKKRRGASKTKQKGDAEEVDSDGGG